jgi:hypothetical protein
MYIYQGNSDTGARLRIFFTPSQYPTLLSCGASKLNAETSSPARPTIIVEKLTVKLDAQHLKT